MKRIGVISITLLIIVLAFSSICIAETGSSTENIILQPPVISLVDGKASPAIGIKPRPTIKITDMQLNTAVKIYDGSQEIATVKAIGSQITTYLPTLSVGEHLLTAETVDSTGNISERSGEFSYTIVLRPPVPVISSVEGNVTATTSTNTSPTIELSSVRPGDTIKIFDGDTEVASKEATDTKITITLTDIGEGAHYFTAAAVDQLGQTSSRSRKFSYTVDLSLNKGSGEQISTITVPVISLVDKKTSPAVSTGVRPTIKITNMLANSTLKIYDGSQELTSIRFNGTELTTYLPTLSVGAHLLTAETVDSAGSVSLRSEVFSYTVITANTAVPVPVIAAIDGKASPAVSTNTSPEVEISNVAPGNTIKIFDEAALLASQEATDSKLVIPVSGLSADDHSLTAVAVDQLGQTSTPSNQFNYSVKAVLTQPTVPPPPETTPTATVSYSNINPTNQDVVATIHSEQPITITNNNGSTDYTFTENGVFQFDFVNEQGNQGNVTATVSNIDKAAPVITIDPYPETPTNDKVIVTAHTNEGTLNAESHEFAQNGTFDFVATDAAANTTTKTITINNILTSTYVIDLIKFGIKNDGTSPIETSAGINKALQYAKEQGFSTIVFPTGTYLISETDPIILDLKNVVIDLNGSTLQINTNGLEKYSIIQIRDGAENVRLTNGTIRGDKDTHDYLTVKTPHEWGCGVVFKGGKDLQMDKVTVTNVTGYGIATESGISANRFHRLFTKSLIQGSISDDGIPVASNTASRTVEPYDISVCGGQFELGYTLGYQGFPYLQNREYTAYFYDSQMKFIQKKDCLQFRKTDIPSGTKYVHLVFPQTNIVGDYSGTYAWISNFRPPTKVRIADCLIKGNRSLGLAFCGGQQWTIENNTFEENGGNPPSYAIDFEDGWELMQDVVVRNNKFINNKNDLVVCAGDNLSFEGNEFQRGAYIWERTTNYKFTGNKFVGGSVTYRIKGAGCEIKDNEYINSNVRTASLSSLTINLTNETLTNSHVFVAPGTKLINSTLQATGKPYLQNAIMEDCTLEVANTEASNLSLKNCLIKNSHMNLHTAERFENCTISDSNFITHSDTTKIEFKSSEFSNSQMMYSTSGAAAQTVFDQCKVTMNRDLPLVRLSAGKTRNLVLKNNTITNQTAKPVIELYDTTYTVPNGNATIEGNNIALTNYGYVFDGVNLTSGIFNLTDTSNNITGATMLHPKYVGNQFLNIKG